VSHGSTFAPNDLAMAAGIATLRELDENGLVGRSARLGELLLERTRELAEEHEVVREARGLGLMWALEFAEPESGSFAWRVIERMQTGLFAQLVVVPLFTKHHIVSQVAGHDLPVLKGLPPLVVTEADVDDFVTALDDVIAKAARPSRVAGMAYRAARAR
jgi:ornithine--oxo-acid transaminase